MKTIADILLLIACENEELFDQLSQAAAQAMDSLCQNDQAYDIQFKWIRAIPGKESV